MTRNKQKWQINELSFLVFGSSIFTFLAKYYSMAGDTITPTLSLPDGETLVSSTGSFELGFFSPIGSQNRYVGIWYKKIATGTIVWVANKENPLTDNSGVLKISNNSNLLLLNGSGDIVWFSNSSKATAQNPVAQLLDSGNFVVKNENDNSIANNFLWQSFDYPFDTMLPEMKLGWDLKTGLNRFLSSSKDSSRDLSPGDYTFGIDIQGVPQMFLWKQKEVKYRAGSWNGLRFTGTPQLNSNPVFKFNFTCNQDEVYYSFELWNQSIVTELVMNQSGLITRLTWNARSNAWLLFFTLPSDQCDNYRSCGAYGSCNIDNYPICQCLDGFEPKQVEDWSSMDWSGGCVRRTKLNCGEGEGFRKYIRVKLPDTRNSSVDMEMSIAECEEACLKNCSCTAFAVADVRGDGSGCLRWYGDLVDMRKLSENGQEIYIKMAASEIDGVSKSRFILKVVAGVVLLLGIIILGIIFFVWKTRKQKKKVKKNLCMTRVEIECIQKKEINIDQEDHPKEDLELPVYDFATISTATDNFSSQNKLGEGGFGPVYKGELPDGQEIAVKRLSKNSKQGLNEFKNEVILIVKLQHRNLVKLLGCCFQGEEMMLIYEYMPNKSLDLIIFDKTRSLTLDWKSRFDIICGIARGLLYLHEDSRLRIIHRDLKPSNILLDDKMVPKISDFGMARTFGGDQSETNTCRVVGTYGYMSPEYMMHGLFSIKSDVFSFGILVLEIISGRRTRGFYHTDHRLNLLGHAWRLWKEGDPLKLMDASVRNSCINLSEALRCIHVAFLCVEQYPEDRPSMPSVVMMLVSETTALPSPKEPGFVTKRNPQQIESLSSLHESGTVNEMTITSLEPR